VSTEDECAGKKLALLLLRICCLDASGAGLFGLAGSSSWPSFGLAVSALGLSLSTCGIPPEENLVVSPRVGGSGDFVTAESDGLSLSLPCCRGELLIRHSSSLLCANEAEDAV